jgi:hypothetical protein
MFTDACLAYMYPLRVCIGQIDKRSYIEKIKPTSFLGRWFVGQIGEDFLPRPILSLLPPPSLPNLYPALLICSVCARGHDTRSNSRKDWIQVCFTSHFTFYSEFQPQCDSRLVGYLWTPVHTLLTVSLGDPFI